MTRPVVGDPADLMRPLLLTEVEEATLRSLLRALTVTESGLANQARTVLAAIESREVEGPHYDYVLAGPWGTIGEGDRSLEATIAGCRDARRQHWAQGRGRDDRYAQIQVERIARYYVTDGDGEDLGEYRGAEVVVPVEDEPLTPEQQAESGRRIHAQRREQRALYDHLRAIQESTALTGDLVVDEAWEIQPEE